MLRKIAMVITGLLLGATVSATTVGQATAAPAPVVKRTAQVTCNGETFNYGGVTLGLGPRMSYYVGTRDGKIRMVRVYTNNGSNATLRLGAVSWSGAVVESQIFGSDYCITFPGSSTGVNITGKQDGQTWIARERW